MGKRMASRDGKRYTHRDSLAFVCAEYYTVYSVHLKKKLNYVCIIPYNIEILED